MSQPYTSALLLLDAQRHHHQALEESDHHAADARLLAWRRAVTWAREQGVLVVFVQRDGDVGSEAQPLTRGWTLHPDFRVEERDVLLRVDHADAFASSPLTLELRSRGVSSLSILALPDSENAASTHEGAEQAGFEVTEWMQQPVTFS